MFWVGNSKIDQDTSSRLKPGGFCSISLQKRHDDFQYPMIRIPRRVLDHVESNNDNMVTFWISNVLNSIPVEDSSPELERQDEDSDTGDFSSEPGEVGGPVGVRAVVDDEGGRFV